MWTGILGSPHSKCLGRLLELKWMQDGVSLGSIHRKHLGRRAEVVLSGVSWDSLQRVS